MGNLKGVKAGDELLLTIRYGGKKEMEQEPEKRRVHKVGRTLVHILRYDGKLDGPTDTYYIENGHSNDGFGHHELWRPEDWKAERQRGSLEECLRLHGVEVSRKRQPVAVLEKLLEVLEEAERGEIK